jgi:beta-1,4-N-acetylglucosaminyltransferase
VIFVTVGTNEARFDRLLAAVARVESSERFVIQHGHSPRIGKPSAAFVDFLPYDRMVTTIRQARAVVTHAGVGSVLVALSNGKRPIVVPRLKKFGEAVDDHQLELGRRFAAAGLVTLVEHSDQLGEALTMDQRSVVVERTAGPLAADVRECLVTLIE